MADDLRSNQFVVVRMLDEEECLSKPVRVRRVMLSDYAWRRMLGPDQYRIARGRGTERPFCGMLLDQKRPGLYICACCGLPLFDSDAKFDSGTGWPSFHSPVARENVTTRPDLSLGMTRTEILCARCDAHLGHVFEDGPAPTGLRYCLNSASLVFLPRDTPWRLEQNRGRYARATFAAGCFWGVQAAFQSVSGVVATAAGYTGGRTLWPSYEEVCAGDTGHAEAVRVVYDTNLISFAALLDVFWNIHDPTTLNRQGPDVGEQYRSAIFCHNLDQRLEAERSLAEKQKSGRFRRSIVTVIADAVPFYRAEQYHQGHNAKCGM